MQTQGMKTEAKKQQQQQKISKMIEMWKKEVLRVKKKLQQKIGAKDFRFLRM